METIRYTFYDDGAAYQQLNNVGDWLSDVLGECKHDGGYDSFEECELDNQLFADMKTILGTGNHVRNFDKYTGPGYEMWHITNLNNTSKWQWDVVVKIEDPTIALQCKLAV